MSKQRSFPAPARGEYPVQQQHAASRPHRKHAESATNASEPQRSGSPVGRKRDACSPSASQRRRTSDIFLHSPWGSPQPAFIPMSRKEMLALGWDCLDILLVNGDAYVDHPSFGAVLLARWLIAHGFRVGLITQPRWDTTEDILAMGTPRLFVGISAGAVDSMLAHYTAFRKKRHDDAYTPGGQAGARPNRACIVYANLARRAFPGIPLVLGGIEASTRRVTHYDFWSDSLRRPLLMDAKADLLIYGMGERAILEMAQRLQQGKDWHGIPGTVWMDQGLEPSACKTVPEPWRNRPCLTLPSFEEIEKEPAQLLKLTQLVEQHIHKRDAWAVHCVGQRTLVMAPPAAILTTAEMDRLYALPFQKTAHPSYTQAIPAEEMLKTSITSHRGCGGGCSFCSLALHQGRRISSRSEASLLDEARKLAATQRSRRKKGVSISDIGGPTANMWQGFCALDQRTPPPTEGKDNTDPPSACRRQSCCYPSVCKHFITPQQDHIHLLRAVAALPDVHAVRVASGVRADLALRDPQALQAYAAEFTGGQLKLAPEHCSPSVLAGMRKPPLEVFERFLGYFTKLSRFAGKEHYIVPYLMSAFPGCTDEDMKMLARWLSARHWAPQQTQCFIPTPGTIATAMFYAQVNERGEPIFVARSDAQRIRQHKILMPQRERVQSKGQFRHRAASEKKRHSRTFSV